MPTIGTNIRRPDNLWLIATSMSQKTGSEPVNASTHGSAEVPECAKVKAGAMVTTLASRSMSEQ